MTATVGKTYPDQLACFTENGRVQQAACKKEIDACFRIAFDLSVTGMALVTHDGRFLQVNQAVCSMLGYSLQELFGECCYTLTHPDDLHREWNDIQRVTSGDAKNVRLQKRYRHRQGHYIWTRVTINRICPVDGASHFFLCCIEDISEHRQVEERLLRQKQELRTLVEDVVNPVVRYDRACRRIYVNAAFALKAKQTVELLIGKTPVELPVCGYAAAMQACESIQRVFTERQASEIEVATTAQGNTGMVHYQMHFYPEFDQAGNVTTVLGAVRDVTEIKSYQQRLHTLAFYDHLTALPNRSLFFEYLHKALAEAARREETVGLLVLGLDHFKVVNDSLGHIEGDRMLREIGGRISTVIRDYDTVSRLGDDEFAVLLPDIREGLDLGSIARKILETVSEPFTVTTSEFVVTASIGIAFYPMDSNAAAELFRFAEAAMHYAKRKGRNNFQFYATELTASATERLALETALRKAVKNNELELYYQPKVTIANGKPIGAEALLRWNRPGKGVVGPNSFITAAEDCGLIVEMGTWVFRSACITARDLNKNRQAIFKIAVNLSARQVVAGDLVDVLSTVLHETACQPEWIELEITESLLIDDRDDVRAILKQLEQMGFTLAIDDFGTGYSALAYLTRFPIHTVKIDRSFICEITSNKISSELVKAIISMASALSLELVAEGVETDEQATMLATMGCSLAQGYLYSRPVPKKQIDALLKFNSS